MYIYIYRVYTDVAIMIYSLHHCLLHIRTCGHHSIISIVITTVCRAYMWFGICEYLGVCDIVYILYILYIYIYIYIYIRVHTHLPTHVHIHIYTYIRNKQYYNDCNDFIITTKYVYLIHIILPNILLISHFIYKYNTITNALY